MIVQSADGTHISLYRAGCGRVLLLVHGALQDHSCWDPVAPLLQKHMTVVSLDRRARGNSGDTLPFAPHREVEDIVAVVHALEAPVTLLGHSSGAVLALPAAVLLGEQVGRLILYEPPIVQGKQQRDLALLANVSALLAAGDRDEAISAFLRDGQGMSGIEVQRLQQSDRWQDLRRLAHTIEYDVRIVAEREGFEADMPRVAVPTVVFSGTQSPLALQAAAVTVASGVPRARLVRLEGAGHNAYRSDPRQFVASVVQAALEHY
jgi:pimeloyl-ACP methyl ester carboxylesterase